ncbi:hypothetical protein AVEN_85478-1, partial [Araneus ventricosus]
NNVSEWSFSSLWIDELPSATVSPVPSDHFPNTFSLLFREEMSLPNGNLIAKGRFEQLTYIPK